MIFYIKHYFFNLIKIAPANNINNIPITIIQIFNIVDKLLDELELILLTVAGEPVVVSSLLVEELLEVFLLELLEDVLDFDELELEFVFVFDELELEFVFIFDEFEFVLSSSGSSGKSKSTACTHVENIKITEIKNNNIDFTVFDMLILL